MLNNNTWNEPSVLVIGAGVSGLTAAKILLDNHFTNVTVMEADNDIGGRVRSVSFGSENLMVDLGAHWLHGLRNNPLLGELVNLKLIDAQFELNRDKLAEMEDDYYSYYYFFDNEFPYSEQWAFQETVGESLNICHKALASPGKMGISKEMLRRDSVGECLNTSLHRWLDERAGSNARKRFFFERSKETVWNLMRFIAGTDQLDAVSFHSFNEFDHEGGDWRPQLSGGLSSMMHSWANLIGRENILLNHAVTKLNWTGDRVQVQFQVTQDVDDDDQRQATSSFDHVIVTCPLEFLKRHHETFFEPKLPRKKVEAFFTMSLGHTEKVFIELSDPVYPESVQPKIMKGFSVHATASESLDPLFHGEHSFYTLDKSGKYFFTVFLGENAHRLMAFPKEELLQKLQEFLSLMVNKPNLRILNLERTNWAANPYILGSYSHSHPKTLGSAFSSIARPLLHDDSKPLILFAGEHTHEFWYSSMHGAFASGKKAAKRLIKLYHKSGKYAEIN